MWGQVGKSSLLLQTLSCHHQPSVPSPAGCCPAAPCLPRQALWPPASSHPACPPRDPAPSAFSQASHAREPGWAVPAPRLMLGAEQPGLPWALVSPSLKGQGRDKGWSRGPEPWVSRTGALQGGLQLEPRFSNSPAPALPGPQGHWWVWLHSTPSASGLLPAPSLALTGRETEAQLCLPPTPRQTLHARVD
jgi:hypothetical protein